VSTTVLEHLAGEAGSQHLDRLVGAAPSLAARDGDRLELLGRPPAAKAKDQPAAREVVQRGSSLG